jgi:hypothetical protein
MPTISSQPAPSLPPSSSGQEQRALAFGEPLVLTLRHGIAMMPIGKPSQLHKRGTAE